MPQTAARLIGRALRRVRAGESRLAWSHPALAGVPETIVLTSPAFAEGQAIPRRHAGAGVGGNVSPALNWSGIPAGTAEIVLVTEDPDAPLPRPVVHAVITGIPPAWPGLPEAAMNAGLAPSRLGRGSFGRTSR